MHLLWLNMRMNKMHVYLCIHFIIESLSLYVQSQNIMFNTCFYIIYPSPSPSTISKTLWIQAGMWRAQTYETFIELPTLMRAWGPLTLTSFSPVIHTLWLAFSLACSLHKYPMTEWVITKHWIPQYHTRIYMKLNANTHWATSLSMLLLIKLDFASWAGHKNDILDKLRTLKLTYMRKVITRKNWWYW